MNMQAYWSGFFTAVALVLLVIVAAFVPSTEFRVFLGAITAVAAGTAAGLSHDARKDTTHG